MDRFVVDASVIVKWLNQDREEHTHQAMLLLELCAQGTVRLFTTDLAVHEVLNALIRGKGLKGKRIEQAVEAFFQLPLVSRPTTLKITATAALLAEQKRITFYDAVYLALAHDVDAPLVTANPKHHKPFGRIRTIPIADFK